MSRAHSIYILRTRGSRKILKAWTVKHEMIIWLTNCGVKRDFLETIWEVVRIQDKHGKEEKLVAWDTIPKEES